MERRLAAIMAADVVGYADLMGRDEAGTLRRLTELRQAILELAARGRLVEQDPGDEPVQTGEIAPGKLEASHTAHR